MKITIKKSNYIWVNPHKLPFTVDLPKSAFDYGDEMARIPSHLLTDLSYESDKYICEGSEVWVFIDDEFNPTK